MKPLKEKLAWMGALVLLLLTNVSVDADCDKCEDLCKLMDQYLQKEKGIELWRKYALSTPESQRTPLPAGVTDIETQVWIEFTAWTFFRKLPCVPATKRARKDSDDVWAMASVQSLAEAAEDDSLPSVDLETVTQDDSCAILYKGKKLEGQTLKDFEENVGCKALSDAVISHENVHQEHCMAAYYQDPKNAPTLLSTPEFVAESELQAWTRHKEIVEEAIRKIVREKGCGWEPTKRQQNDMNAIPSLKQTQQMENRGWQAVKALSKKP